MESKVLWVSIGENCLSDAVLSRHNKKSYSSVFSSARSNIEYVLQMENDGYKNLLDEKWLNYFHEAGGGVRSSYYKDVVGCYSQRHMLGFEFSHHDPINIKEDNRAFARRISRQVIMRGRKDFVFLYHHRVTEHSNIPLLRKHLKELLNLYNVNGCECNVILFYQHIIDEATDKNIAFISHNNDLLEFVFNTHDVWAGDDPDIFWAKKDDELFKKMFIIADEKITKA